MQAVMMVAGKSTRTYPLTLTRPKPLLKIANKAIIEYNLEQLRGIITEVILIVGYQKEMIQHYLGDSWQGIKIQYCEQKEQLGTGHAVLQTEPYVKGRFIVMNGDDIFAREDIQKLLDYKYAALVMNVEHPSLYGVYKVDDNHRVLDLVEKPKEFIGTLANMGCYIFERDIFEYLRLAPLSERGEIEITTAILDCAQKNAFYVCPSTGFWWPTAYPWQLLPSQKFFMDDINESSVLGKVEAGVTIKGKVIIGEHTIVKAGSYVEGPVIIGDHCSIGPNCYLRPYTAIGNNCSIGQSVEIKNSIIGDGTLISHLSYIGDSIIGEGVNLGAGFVVANLRHDGKNVFSLVKGKLVDTGMKKFGTVIGDGVKTGIHTSVYPGRKIWPRLVTLPGAVVKEDLITPE